MQIIKEHNPNIDWNLFNQIFEIANKCVNPTTIGFATDSMYLRHLSRQTSKTVETILAQDRYMEFRDNILDRASNKFLNLLWESKFYAKNRTCFEVLDAPSVQPKFEPQYLDKTGAIIQQKQLEETQEKAPD